MIVFPTRDRRAERREATRAEILEAAWGLARTQGLAGLSLRDVASRIGARPPSLYWYFDSKHAIYDAMFAEAHRRLLRRLEEQDWPEDRRELMRALARVVVEFCTEDVARYQLMFQHAIPDFELTPASYALSVELDDQLRARLRAAGVTDQADIDLWTALTAGMSAQQTANQPGGDRWVRLVDEAVDMYADHVFRRPASGRT